MVLAISAENITLLGVVKKHKEDLADYVRRVLNEKGLTLRQVEARSQRQITHGYVSKVVSRAVLNLSTEKLKALAKGLGVPEEDVFSAARGESSEDDPKFTKSRFGVLSLKFDKIPPDKRVNVEALIDLLDRELDRLAQQ